MDDLKRQLESKPQRSDVSVETERLAELRWAGKWRMVHAGVTFKVTAVREDRVYLRSTDKLSDAVIKVGDMEFLASAGEIKFLGK